MSLLAGWLWVLASVIGNAEFWVILVNRSHALAIHHRRLKLMRRIHDVAVPGWPMLLLWLTGLGPDSLLRGGSLWEQSLWTRRLVLFSSLWCTTLIMQTLWWQLRQKKQARFGSPGQRFDVASATGDPAARGTPGLLARLWPGNEYCRLECNIKPLRITPVRQRPEKPADSLRILHLSDLHFIGTPGTAYYEFVVQIALQQQPDLILFSGDLIDRPALLPVAVQTLQPLTAAAPCCFVLGNHDWREDFEEVRRQLQASGWRSVAGTAEILILKGRRVLIGGSERPWIGTEPPLVRDSFCDLTILLSHSPDQLTQAQKLGYDLMLAGHTHGGQVVLPVVGPVFSPSRYGVALASGLFLGQPTTLHVSRGLGAKDPIRWNCTPELTVLQVDF